MVCIPVRKTIQGAVFPLALKFTPDYRPTEKIAPEVAAENDKNRLELPKKQKNSLRVAERLIQRYAEKMGIPEEALPTLNLLNPERFGKYVIGQCTYDENGRYIGVNSQIEPFEAPRIAKTYMHELNHYFSNWNEKTEFELSPEFKKEMADAWGIPVERIIKAYNPGTFGLEDKGLSLKIELGQKELADLISNIVCREESGRIFVNTSQMTEKQIKLLNIVISYFEDFHDYTISSKEDATRLVHDIVTFIKEYTEKENPAPIKIAYFPEKIYRRCRDNSFYIDECHVEALAILNMKHIARNYRHKPAYDEKGDTSSILTFYDSLNKANPKLANLFKETVRKALSIKSSSTNTGLIITFFDLYFSKEMKKLNLTRKEMRDLLESEGGVKLFYEKALELVLTEKVDKVQEYTNQVGNFLRKSLASLGL